MALYRRKQSPYLWCKFTVNGRLVQKSTGTITRSEAKKFEAKLKAELLAKPEQKKPDPVVIAAQIVKPTQILTPYPAIKPVHTWNDAVEMYYAEKLIVKPSQADQSELKWLHKHLNGVDITKINRTFLAKVGNIKLSTGVMPSTVNSMMKLVRAVLHQAVEWDWLEKAPKVRMFPAGVVKLRFISRDDADRLVAALPPYLAVLAEFSFQTGLRMSNATHLKWANVNLEKKQAWVNAEDAKMRKPIPVPLSEVAIRLIESQIGKHGEYVFVHKGKPTTTTSCYAWYAALRETGIENYRWHDIRKTWASWHVQNGTSLLELKELGGWSDLSSVLIYAHLGSQHLAKLVNLPVGAATLMGTLVKQEQASIVTI